MTTIQARRGNTVLTLTESAVDVEIAGAGFGPFRIDAHTRQRIWAPLQTLNLPLAAAPIGIGGVSSDVLIELGGTTLSFAWWMAVPAGWEPVGDVFASLAALIPPEIRGRYDFAHGSE